MKATSIKNVVIWALVAVNLIFLAIYLYGVYRDGAVRAQALRDLSALCSASGISLDTGNIGSGGVVQEYASDPSEAAEKKIADTLLGNTSKTELGGNTVEYAGDKGRASFRSGGKFEVKLNSGASPRGTDARKTAEALLKSLGVGFSSVTDGGDGQLTAVCALDGLPVFNCTVVLTFKNGSLDEISGKLPGTLRPTYRADMSSAATAVMSILSKVKNDVKNDPKSELIRCTQIRAVAPGYVLAETNIPGAGKLEPVWRLETDAGVYVYETVSGSIRPY